MFEDFFFPIVNHPKPHSHTCTHAINQLIYLLSVAFAPSIVAFAIVVEPPLVSGQPQWPEIACVAKALHHLQSGSSAGCPNLKRGHISWPTPSPVPPEFHRNPPDDSANIGARDIAELCVFADTHTHGGKFGRPLKHKYVVVGRVAERFVVM